VTAEASTVHERKETGGTAKVTAQRYSDSACTAKGESGKFQTVPVEGTQKVKATQTSNFVLKAAPLGIQIEITCQEQSAVGATVTDVEEGDVMKIDGGAQKIVFSKCTVNKLAGCTVAQPIEVPQLVSETEDFASEVMRTRFSPSEGNRFVVITLENCGLLNGGHTIEGTASSESEGTTTQKFTSSSVCADVLRRHRETRRQVPPRYGSRGG
jgi:hypothetical protein